MTLQFPTETLTPIKVELDSILFIYFLKIHTSQYFIIMFFATQLIVDEDRVVAFTEHTGEKVLDFSHVTFNIS